MAISDRFFKVIKDVILITEEVKRLNGQFDKLGDKIEAMDRRLVRIETMVEIAATKALPRE